MLIDVHVHYGYSFFPIEPANAETLISTMDKYKIDISMVSSFRGIFYDFRDCNSEMFRAIEAYPQRLQGYVVLNPNYPELSQAELKKYREHPQFAGVKLHASWHNKPIDGKEFAFIFDLCDEWDIPMLIHSYVEDDFSDQVSSPERIANVAKRHKNKIIMAHMGGNSRRACRAIANLENLYMDISSGRERASQLYVWELERIANAVKEVGADRILFGTDFPLLDPSICLGMFEDAILSEEDFQKIAWENAVGIFKITDHALKKRKKK
jgi:Predicted metal-dependent hydrolase of the TIM-barrel fold